MINLTEALNTAATNKGNESVQKDRVNDTSSYVSKRSTNRTLACSVELRDRLRVMAATKGVPMQELLESWMKEKLTEAGF